jgi:hypothetical protein
MGDVVVSFDETPNPDARKATLCREAPPREDGRGGIRSYVDPAQAEGDALARAILEIPDVAGVLIGRDWITINRRSGASWGALQRRVRERLGEVLGG